jgi:DNA-binding transcriptional ArsR family regulator
MNDKPYIAEVGALIGDPARANILVALSEGHALTATELSLRAGVSPQTASAHLGKLLAGGLVAVAAQGRHRYYRLAGPDVAHALEALMVLSAGGPTRHRPPGPRDRAMREARTCYDHLAGRLGIAIADALLERHYLEEADRVYRVTGPGHTFFKSFGLDLPTLKGRRRSFARPCLDWSERRPHLAGALGAAVAERCFALGWLDRCARNRTVTVTERGRRGLRGMFGIDAA